MPLFGMIIFLESPYLPEDVELNRAGHLSARQARKLTWSAAFWLALIGLDLTLVLGLWAVYLSKFLGQPVYLVIFWSALLLLLALPAFRHGWPLVKDIQSGAVGTISGTLSRQVEPVRFNKGYVAEYRVGIQALTFQVSPAVYNQLIEGRAYSIFYTLNTHKIVNLVPIQ
jgi:hypothetical protein